MARILTVWVPLFKFLSDFKAYEEVLILDTKESCKKDQILFHGCFLDKLKSSNIFEGIWIQQNFLSFMINQGKEKAYRLLSHNIRDVVLQIVKIQCPVSEKIGRGKPNFIKWYPISGTLI